MMTLEFHGKADLGEALVSVNDLTGTTLRQFLWQGETAQINLSDLPNGVYFMKIDMNGSAVVRKVVLQ
jgi:hypothetical protein